METLEVRAVPADGSLSLLAFDDQNQNAVWDSSEAGVSGATVTYDRIDQVPDPRIATTGADGTLTEVLELGSYSYTVAVPGGYSVSIPFATFSEFSIADAQVTSITLPLMNSSMSGGGGSAPGNGASIRGQMWYEANADWVQNPEEIGAGGMAVQLLDGSGLQLLSTATDIDGEYVFSGLAAGTYRVTFARPASYAFCPSGIGSDPDPSTGVTAPLTVTGGQHLTDVDAGLIYNSSLSFAVRKCTTFAD